MGFGRPLLVHDTPENREVAGDTAIYWDARRPETLAEGLAALLSDPDGLRRRGDAATGEGFGPLPLVRRDRRLRTTPFGVMTPPPAGHPLC